MTFSVLNEHLCDKKRFNGVPQNVYFRQYIFQFSYYLSTDDIIFSLCSHNTQQTHSSAHALLVMPNFVHDGLIYYPIIYLGIYSRPCA